MVQDKLELFITGSLIIALIFLTLTFELSLGAIFIGMILFNIWVFFAFPGRLTHNSKPNNTFNAILFASIALVVILFATLFLTTSFQGILNSAGSSPMVPPLSIVSSLGPSSVFTPARI